MNKALTPLEALESIIDTFYDKNTEDIKIVRNALKDSEMEHTLRVRLENINYELVREKQANEKKLEALEIIKDIITIDSRDIGNNRVCVIIDGTSKIQKEEFDLLKEVLNEINI